jgi:energy-dependent translational throttle protein EttA
LIKMLTGNKDVPDSGEIKVGNLAKFVSVGQDRMEELNPKKTVYYEILEGLDEIELGNQSVMSCTYLRRLDQAIKKAH